MKKIVNIKPSLGYANINNQNNALRCHGKIFNDSA